MRPHRYALALARHLALDDTWDQVRVQLKSARRERLLDQLADFGYQRSDFPGRTWAQMLPKIGDELDLEDLVGAGEPGEAGYGPTATSRGPWSETTNRSRTHSKGAAMSGGRSTRPSPSRGTVHTSRGIDGQGTPSRFTPPTGRSDLQLVTCGGTFGTTTRSNLSKIVAYTTTTTTAS